MEDWALIRRLAAEQVPKAVIARRLGISRTTVVKAVASQGPPKYERRPAPTSFTPFEARVRQLLEETPDLPATVLAERVGWTGSIRWFRDNVNRVRADHARIDPADRLSWAAGDAAQCDLWFPPRKVLLEDGSGTLLPVLVMTCAYSRFTLARMIPTRKTQDLLLGSWSLLEQLGGVPRRLIWDNESGIGRRKLTEPAAVFAGTLATRIVLLRPRDPESKGVVERRNGWFETSFMPGRHFESPADFNTQFTDWLTTANSRQVRTTKTRPVDALAADKAAMLPLPPAVMHLGRRDPRWVRPGKHSRKEPPTALSHCVVSELLDAFHAGDGPDLIRKSMRTVMQELSEAVAAVQVFKWTRKRRAHHAHPAGSRGRLEPPATGLPPAGPPNRRAIPGRHWTRGSSVRLPVKRKAASAG
jgi:transposase